MAALFRIILGIHIVAGAIALLVVWIPLVAKKGGPVHRRVGWVYVSAAAVVAVTGILSSARLLGDGHPRHARAGIFLAYVGVFAAESALLGILALRGKWGPRAGRSRVALIGPLFLVAGGVALAVFGAYQGQPLYIFFAILSVVQGAAHLRFMLVPPSSRHERFLAHMGAMGTSCITTLTAFVVVNAPRLGMRTFDIRLWVVPIVVLGIGLTIWRRSYAKRFANADTIQRSQS